MQKSCRLAPAGRSVPKGTYGRGRMGLGSGSVLGLVAVVLAGCASTTPAPEIATPAAPAQVYPSRYHAEEFVGRWGYASYQRPDDRVRTENAARGQCSKPYIIRAGTHGGVIMHLADQTQPQELLLKADAGGKNYIGPEGPPGGMQDREIQTFDGRLLEMKWIDPEVESRYGIGVYARCGAEGAVASRTSSRSKKK